MAALDYHGNALLLLKVSHLPNCADVFFTNVLTPNMLIALL